MGDAHTAAVVTAEPAVLDALAPTLDNIRRSLGKEGASLDVGVDEETSTLTATLVRHRIVCDGCILPEDLVATMLKKSLKSAGHRYTVVTRNWIIER